MNELINVIENIGKKILLKPDDKVLYRDYLGALKLIGDKRLSYKYSTVLRGYIRRGISSKSDILDDLYDLNNECLLYEARGLRFDSYLQYIEKDRELDKRFWLPRRQQLLPVVDSIQKLIDDELDILSISLPPGTGKAQPLDSKVLTQYGFKRMGDIKLGELVSTPDGSNARVVGIFPQGVQDVYKVSFTDGTSARCTLDHLWTVQTREDRLNRKSRTLALKDMLHNIRVSGDNRCNYSIEYIKPKEYPKQDLLVDPYLLGVILGDGGLTNASLVITNTEQDIIEKVKSRLNTGDVLKQIPNTCSWRVSKEIKGRELSEVFKGLDYYNLLGCTSEEKFIPQEYLRSSVEDRLELLRGLADTDGYISSGCCLDYTTVSPKLRDGIKELVLSLGGKVKITSKVGTYRKGDTRCICKTSYRMFIFFPNTIIPVSSEKHLSKYECKRDKFLKYISSVELVGSDKCQCIMLDTKEGLYVTDDYIITHNSTLEIFLHTMMMGAFPDHHSLASGHSSTLTKSIYTGVLEIIQDDVEYRWRDIYPNITNIITNSKEQTIDLNMPHRFSTLTCRSIDGSLTGATRCNKLLTADDLVSGIEEALSIDRLNKLWDKYRNDLKSRKKIGCKELHLATRWSVHDPIGRLQRMYNDDERCEFLVVPAFDENGESNFDYKYRVGFDNKFLNDMKETLDDVSFRALYMNQPIEREGILYHPDELRRYFELPKEIEPDGVIGVCDTKDKGKDYAFLPVAYIYGDDYYIEDCVCDNGVGEGVEARLVDILLRHKVQQCRFESNSAGGRIAKDVQAQVKAHGGITHITTAYTTSNKETKIIVNSEWVKKHCLFKEHGSYAPKSDYGKMMSFLTSYTQTGRNTNDDVPDGMAMLAVYVNNLLGSRVEVFKRPF